MRLNAFTDYCLRVLIYVAVHPDDRATIAEVARSYDISEHHLTKVVHFLGKAGYLDNVRGHGGGLRLPRPASDINVGAVVREAEGRDVPATCFDPAAPACAIDRACILKCVLEEAVAAFHAVLDRYSLADVVSNGGTLRGILVVEPVRHAAERA